MGENKVKGVVDIVFVIDVTGSMQPWIDGLKDNIKVFFDSLRETDANNSVPIKDWRAKIVGYRDFEDNQDDWLENNDFTSTLEDVYNQLDSLHAKGGGDLPETLLDALMVVANMPECGIQDELLPSMWRNESSARRAVIVFTDAPFKKELFYGDYKGGDIDDVLNALENAHIMLNVITPLKDAQGDVLDMMNDLTIIKNSTYYPLMNEAGESVSLDKFIENKEAVSDMLQKLAKTVSIVAVGSF